MVLKVDTLNDQAYSILKDKILKKEIPSGTRLVDSQLAEEFGISRTPLRDAIRKLAEDGLVVSSPKKKGYYVYQPSAKDIEEIFELRLMFDVMAATKLINEIIPKHPEALDELKKSYQAVQESGPESFAATDEDFHDTVVRLCDNSRMLTMYKELRSQTRAFRSETASNKVRLKKAGNYHERIFNGICAGDLQMTLDALRQHVEFSKEDALADYLKEHEGQNVS